VIITKEKIDEIFVDCNNWRANVMDDLSRMESYVESRLNKNHGRVWMVAKKEKIDIEPYCIMNPVGIFDKKEDAVKACKDDNYYIFTTIRDMEIFEKPLPLLKDKPLIKMDTKYFKAGIFEV
jgi:hypothetical protein